MDKGEAIGDKTECPHIEGIKGLSVGTHLPVGELFISKNKSKTVILNPEASEIEWSKFPLRSQEMSSYLIR